MIGYNPSHLNKNETLLEAFHRVEAYLKANPQYQVFQSSATYQEGTQEYALNTIVVPEGSSVGKGDVVLFSNVYYAVIIAVSETTFSVETATNFRGTTGATGATGAPGANGTDGKDGVTPNISMNATVENNGGDLLVKVTKSGTNENPLFTLGFHNIKGATGDKGETGLPALMYSKGVTTGPYSSFVTDLNGYNRTPQINDSCIYVSTNMDYLILGTIQQVFSDRQEASVNKVFSIDIQGRQGEKGDIGPQGPQGQQGPQGPQGPQGVGVKSITSGTPTVVNDKTNTPITITLTDNTTVDLVVSAENGKDGTSVTVDIVQATGQSESAVMSQKAVTDELAKKATTSEVNAKYTKPSDGIPKSDLASSVQTSLGKADTALQNVPSYNDLPNIPVINQDLSASGFTPTANTYYRHTGATNGTFTQGVIYLYDTAYHKLGESGGGGGGGSLTKHVVEMTPANYEAIKNDIPKMVGTTIDMEGQGIHYKGNMFSFFGNKIVAFAIDEGDTALHIIGVRLNVTRVDGMYYIYSPGSDNTTVEFIDDSSNFMSSNPTFTLTYWTE